MTWQSMDNAPKDRDILIFDCYDGRNPVYTDITYMYRKVVQVFWDETYIGGGFVDGVFVNLHGRWMPRTDIRPGHHTTETVHPLCWCELELPEAFIIEYEKARTAANNGEL